VADRLQLTDLVGLPVQKLVAVRGPRRVADTVIMMQTTSVGLARIFLFNMISVRLRGMTDVTGAAVAPGAAIDPTAFRSTLPKSSDCLLNKQGMPFAVIRSVF
jgi:hypothetical protein